MSSSPRPSPPKPYELARSTAGSSTPSRLASKSSGEDGNSGAPPRVPSRPQASASASAASSSSYSRPGYNGYASRYGGGYGNSYGNSSYGVGYGNSYGNSYGGGYGGYNNSGRYGRYGSYGGSYGGYGSYGGSGYGGYGGGRYYGRYGAGPDGPYGPEPPPPGGLWQNALDASQNGIQRFGSVIEGFSRFSGLLDANFDAVHGSFSSVIRLVDVFGEFMHVVRTFAVFRAVSGAVSFLWRVFNFMIGREIGVRAAVAAARGAQNTLHASDFAEFQQRRGSWPWLAIAVATGCVSLPLLVINFVRAVRRMRELSAVAEQELGDVSEVSDSDDGKGPRPGFDAPLGDRVPSSSSPGPVVARALYDFVGENEMEISFRRGDQILVLDRPFPDWWEGEANGRRGLFPSNHCDLGSPPLPTRGVPSSSSRAALTSSGSLSSGEQAGSASSSSEPLEGDDVKNSTHRRKS